MGAQLSRQTGDLDQVVRRDRLSGPDPDSFGAIQAGAVPAVSPFEAADPALAAGSPFHGASECGCVFGGLSGLTRFAFAGNHHVPHAHLVQGVIDAGLAVASVGGDDPGFAAVP